MGRHVAVGRSRGVAGWPLVALGVVVLLVAGAITYFAVLRNNDEAAVGRCQGTVTLPILASSGSSPAARALSDAFNATGPTARSTCLTTSVTTMTSPDAVAALTGQWSGRDDDAPGVWITDDGSALADVDEQASELTAGRDADPIATSPVVLAMTADDAPAADGLAWADLGSSFGADGTVKRADGSPIELLLPDPRKNRASSYALASALGSEGAAVGAAAAKAGAQKIADTAGPDSALPTTGVALEDIASGAVAGAVPVTEAELARFNTGNGADLTAVYPSGPTAGDEVYVLSLTGDWMTPTLRDAATRFHTFAGDEAGLAILSAANLRVAATDPSSAAGVDQQQAVTPLPASAPGVAAALADGLGLAGRSPTEPDPASSDPASSDPASSDPASSDPASSDPASSGPAGTAGEPIAGTASSSGTTSVGSATVSSETVATSQSGATSKAVTSQAATSKTATSKAATSKAATSTVATSKKSAPKTTATTATVPAGPNVTLLVDTSSTWNTVIEGQTRVDWLRQALTGVVEQAGSTGIGLWAVGSGYSDGYSVEVPAGPLTAEVDGRGVRSAELASAIAGLAADGTRRNYGAVPVALTEAAKTATAQQPHIVILVTDGGDQTPSTSRASVVEQIRGAIGDTPTTLSVLGVGEAAPDAALQDLAQAGNGQYYDVTSTTYLPEMLLQAVQDATG